MASIIGVYNTYMTWCRNAMATDITDLRVVFNQPGENVCDWLKQGGPPIGELDAKALICFGQIGQLTLLTTACKQHDNVQAACEGLAIVSQVLAIVFAPLLFCVVMIGTQYWDAAELFSETHKQLPAWVKPTVSRNGAIMMAVFGLLFSLAQLLVFASTACPSVERLDFYLYSNKILDDTSSSSSSFVCLFVCLLSFLKNQTSLCNVCIDFNVRCHVDWSLGSTRCSKMDMASLGCTTRQIGAPSGRGW